MSYTKKGTHSKTTEFFTDTVFLKSRNSKNL